MAMARPMADCETPNERANSASTGMTAPNPSWLIAIIAHIQIRMRSRPAGLTRGQYARRPALSRGPGILALHRLAADNRRGRNGMATQTVTDVLVAALAARGAEREHGVSGDSICWWI